MASFLPFGIVPIFQAQDISRLQMANTPGMFLGRLWKKTVAFFARVKQALGLWLKQPKYLLGAALVSYVHMACTFAMVSVILQGLGDPISFWRVGGLWVLIYFITLLPISINGLGLQEFSLSLIYTNLAGVSEANSLVLALLMRVIFMIASLPGAIFLPEVLSGDQKVRSVDNQQGINHE